MPNQPYMLDPSSLPPIPDGPVYMPAAPPPQPGALYGNTQRPMDGIPQFENVAVLTADGQYRNVEYVNILTPGDTKSMPRAKVTNYHRQKYAPWYKAWRDGLEMAPDGSPVEMWPLLTPAQVRELKAKNVFTVEQLANLADSNLQHIPMGATLKLKALAWLKDKEKADDIEGRRRKEELVNDNMRMLEKQIADLSAALLRQQTQPGVQPDASEPVRRGPGRPKADAAA